MLPIADAARRGFPAVDLDEAQAADVRVRPRRSTSTLAGPDRACSRPTASSWRSTSRAAAPRAGRSRCSSEPTPSVVFAPCRSGVPSTRCRPTSAAPSSSSATSTASTSATGTSSRRAREVADERGLAGRRGHLRPAPDGGAAPRARPADADPHRRAGPSCWPRPGSTHVLVLPVHPRDRGLVARGVRRPGARRRAARRGRGGRRQLPLRPPGRRRRGDCCARPGESRDFAAEGIALDGGPQVWSSTYVRTCLAAGDVAGAAEALGPAVHRARRRRRGRPARPRARLPDRQRARPAPAAAAPADGVYAGWLRAARHRASASRPRSASAPTRPSTASASAGSRPTCSTATTSSSTASRSRSRSSSGCAAWSRSTSVDALVETMADDVARARELLAAVSVSTADAARAAPRRGSSHHGLPYFVPTSVRADVRRDCARRAAAAGRCWSRCSWRRWPAGARRGL